MRKIDKLIKKDLKNIYKPDEAFYEDTIQKLGIVKNENSVKREKNGFILKLALVNLVIILFCNVMTFVGTRAYYTKNTFHQTIINNEEMFNEACEYILQECDDVINVPIISLYIEQNYILNIYKATNYNEDIENIYYYQSIYLRNEINENINLEFSINDNKQIIDINNNKQIGVIELQTNNDYLEIIVIFDKKIVKQTNILLNN